MLLHWKFFGGAFFCALHILSVPMFSVVQIKCRHIRASVAQRNLVNLYKQNNVHLMLFSNFICCKDIIKKLLGRIVYDPLKKHSIESKDEKMNGMYLAVSTYVYSPINVLYNHQNYSVYSRVIEWMFSCKIMIWL